MVESCIFWQKRAKQMEDSLNYRIIEVPIGKSMTFVDTLTTSDTILINSFETEVVSIIPNGKHPDYEAQEGDLAISAKVKIQQVGKEETYEVAPLIVLRNNLIFTFPVQINDLAFKVKLPSTFLDQVFKDEFELEYKSFQMKQGERINFNGYEIRLEQINRAPRHPSYVAEANDVAAGATLKVTKNGSTQAEFVEPVFLLRDMKPMLIKDKIPAEGLSFQFTNIDPNSGKMTIGIAQTEANMNYPIEFATNSLRTDYIVFEAIIFPGINFFWTGTVLMMLGLAISWLQRRKG